MMESGRQFNLFPSHIGLKKYILYYNVVFPTGDTFIDQYTLMPNGCGTLSLAFDGAAVIAELWGASVTPVLLGTEPNRYRVLLLIHLSPYGLYQVTRQSQEAFVNRRLSLADIDSELFESLYQAFLSSQTAADLVAKCEAVLSRRMERLVVADALVSAAAVISSRQGQIRVQEVARQVCYSERQLNRLFLSQIGMRIKSYVRLTRFNYVLKHMGRSPALAALSQQAGYFDQAHFDKDFKAISGVSPRDYLKTMSDFYYDGMETCHIISSEEE